MFVTFVLFSIKSTKNQVTPVADTITLHGLLLIGICDRKLKQVVLRQHSVYVA